MKYRKKPVIVDAVQWKGTKDSWKEISALGGDYDTSAYESGEGMLLITTRNGNRTAMPEDWVVKDSQGELYILADPIFQAGYEPA